MTELYVANTDNNWFDFLRARQPWEEVNFWKPSQQIFKAIDEGGLFVFRLKAPRNVIGGYGILVSSINAPIKLAWDSLGEANGVPSIENLVTAIARYRTSRDTTEHSLIGCRLISNPVFFSEDQWFEVPSSWQTALCRARPTIRAPMKAFASCSSLRRGLDLKRDSDGTTDSSKGLRRRHRGSANQFH